MQHCVRRVSNQLLITPDRTARISAFCGRIAIGFYPQLARAEMRKATLVGLFFVVPLGYALSELLFPPLEIILPSADHQVHVCCQYAAGSKVIERRANDSEKDGHTITSVFPQCSTDTLGQKQHKQGNHHARHHVVQIQFGHLLHRFLLRALTLHRDLLRALVRRTCTEQYRSTLLPLAL